MTEYKKLSYKSEDTFKLGLTLPVVAMRQLPKLAKEFDELPDNPDYMRDTQHAFADGIMRFYNENLRYMDDERQLRENFQRVVKLAHYSHKYLALFER